MPGSIFCTNEFAWVLLVVAFLAGAFITLGVSALARWPPQEQPPTIWPRG